MICRQGIITFYLSFFFSFMVTWIDFLGFHSLLHPTSSSLLLTINNTLGSVAGHALRPSVVHIRLCISLQASSPMLFCSSLGLTFLTLLATYTLQFSDPPSLSTLSICICMYVSMYLCICSFISYILFLLIFSRKILFFSFPFELHLSPLCSFLPLYIFTFISFVFSLFFLLHSFPAFILTFISLFCFLSLLHSIPVYDYVHFYLFPSFSF